MNRPNTVREWQEYVSSLAGQHLFSQAVAANTQTFARSLLDEGYSMFQVERILLAFVRQLRATGTKVPDGGAFDLVTMALTDDVARKGVRMSEEEANFLVTTHKGSTDEFDQFLLETEF